VSVRVGEVGEEAAFGGWARVGGGGMWRVQPLLLDGNEGEGALGAVVEGWVCGYLICTAVGPAGACSCEVVR
jgi:hypothetical protein